jgi:hypothetical protein
MVYRRRTLSARYFLQRNSFHVPSPTPATVLNPDSTKVAGATLGLCGTVPAFGIKAHNLDSFDDPRERDLRRLCRRLERENILAVHRSYA